MAFSPYIPLLILFLFAAILSGGLLLLSHLLGPKKSGVEKGMPYECGIDPIGSARDRFSVKFYLVAMLFILFDVETVFLYPWAVLFREFAAAGYGLAVFVEMAIFLGILALGLFYLYARRALEWE